MRTAVVDGDVLAYQACSIAGGSKSIQWFDKDPGWMADPADGTQERDPRHAIRIAGELLEHWLELAKCTDVIAAISGESSMNFRKDVHPEYKRKRPADKPECYSDVVQWLLDRHNGTRCDNLEGDDIMGLLLTQGDADVAVSTDKDIYTLPGEVLRIPHAKAKDPTPHLQVLTEHAADLFWMHQTLTGDSVDEYRGCPGIGPAAATKALYGTNSLGSMWRAVKDVYVKQARHLRWGRQFVWKERPYVEALANARVARILRKGDYDWNTNEVKLWQP